MAKYQGTAAQHFRASLYMQQKDITAAEAYFLAVQDVTYSAGPVTELEIPDVPQLHIGRLEEMASELIAEIRTTGSSRELSLAITKVEEAAFWASRHRVAS